MKNDTQVWKLNAKVIIETNIEHTKIILTSIKPELDIPSSNRVQVIMDSYEDQLLFQFRASDVVALRAALNSFLRWVTTVLNIIECLQFYPQNQQ